MRIQFSELYIYIFIALLGYGFYGAGTIEFFNASEPVIALIYFLAPILIFATLLNKEVFNLHNNNLYFLLPKIHTIKTELLIIIFFTLFLAFLSRNYLLISVTNDGLYYASNGIIHLIKIVEILTLSTDLFNEISVRAMVRGVSLLFILCFSLFIFIAFQLRDITSLWKVIFFLCILIILRTIILILGGAENPHPPLIGLPALLFTSFFGISDFSLKLSYFLPYIAFIFFVFQSFKKMTSFTNAMIWSLAISSIPGVLFLGSTVEQSIWSMMCFSIVLIMLLNNQNINYRNIFLVILLFSFMRSASIFAIFPVILHALFIQDPKVFYSKKFKSIFIDALPLIIFLPFFAFATLQSSSITIDRLSPIDGLEKLFLEGSLLFNPLDTFGNLFSIIFISLLALNLNNKYGFLNLVFFFLLVIIYNFIDPSGHSKYQFEIFIPIMIFSLLLFFRRVNATTVRFSALVGLALIIMNIVTISNFKDICLDKDNPFNDTTGKYETKFGCNFLTHAPFKLNKAYQSIKENEGSLEGVYMPGTYYQNALSPVMFGISVSEWKSIKEILQKQISRNIENQISWISGDARLIDQDDKINNVLLAETINREDIYKELQGIGWKVTFEESNETFRTKVVVLSRN